jgi:hypothetical protein
MFADGVLPRQHVGLRQSVESSHDRQAAAPCQLDSRVLRVATMGMLRSPASLTGMSQSFESSNGRLRIRCLGPIAAAGGDRAEVAGKGS